MSGNETGSARWRLGVAAQASASSEVPNKRVGEVGLLMRRKNVATVRSTADATTSPQAVQCFPTIFAV